MRLLLVEDDSNIVDNLTIFLREEGFLVLSVEGQNKAVDILDREKFDLVLIDVFLADGNGYAVCSAIKSKHNIPVIFLTASGDEFSVVTGLDMGADDYIIKPFRPRELVSRIKSVLRRTGKVKPIIEIDNLKVDSLKGSVYKNENEIFLSALEYRLLLLFLNNVGIVLSREKLIDEIWDMSGEFVNDNTLTVYIKRLREKIEDDSQNPTIIKTIRGLGYKAGD